MIFFAQELLWESQMSTYTTAVSDLGGALMTCGFEAKVVSLKRCKSFKTLLIMSGDMTPNLLEYGSPMIFIYDLDLGRWGLSMESRLTFWTLFKYFSIVDKSRLLAGLFVVMMILLTLKQMKSAKMFDLEFFKHLLTLDIWMWAELIINSALVLVIGIMTSLLDWPLVVILILGFFVPPLLFFAFNIFPTSSADKVGNASFTQITSSMLDELLALEVCA